MGNDLILFGIYIFLIIASLGFHEFGHAWVASLCGDDTARDLGRVTLNPIAHVDPIMTVVMPLFTIYAFGFPFGGAKPVPVQVNNLRNPRWGNLLVTLAGPAANLVLAIVFAIVLVSVFGTDVLIDDAVPVKERFAELSQNGLFKVLCGLVFMNLLLVVFNLLPVPPLDGSHVVGAFLPPDVARAYQGVGMFGIVILLIALNMGNGAGFRKFVVRPVHFAVTAMRLEWGIVARGTDELHAIVRDRR